MFLPFLTRALTLLREHFVYVQIQSAHWQMQMISPMQKKCCAQYKKSVEEINTIEMDGEEGELY